MPRKYTDARKENNRKWDAENLDRMSLALPKGQKERIQAAAAASGEKSVNSWISKAIEARLTGAQTQEQPAQAQQQPAQPDGSMVSINPEDLDTMRQHLERYEYDEAAFLARAIKQQIDIDTRHSRMGSNIELVFERLEQKKKQEAEERERLLAERDSQECV